MKRLRMSGLNRSLHCVASHALPWVENWHEASAKGTEAHRVLARVEDSNHPARALLDRIAADLVVIAEQGIVLNVATGEARLDDRLDDGSPLGPFEISGLEPYFIAKHEVTQAQWLRVMGSNPSHFRRGSPAGNRFFKRSEQMEFESALTNPVETVDWYSAVEFARRLGCTLPTEVRWEVACRCGLTRDYGTPRDANSLSPVPSAARPSRTARRMLFSFMDLRQTRRSTCPTGRCRSPPNRRSPACGRARPWHRPEPSS